MTRIVSHVTHVSVFRPHRHVPPFVDVNCGGAVSLESFIGCAVLCTAALQQPLHSASVAVLLEV